MQDDLKTVASKTLYNTLLRIKVSKKQVFSLGDLKMIDAALDAGNAQGYDKPVVVDAPPQAPVVTAPIVPVAPVVPPAPNAITPESLDALAAAQKLLADNGITPTDALRSVPTLAEVRGAGYIQPGQAEAMVANEEAIVAAQKLLGVK